MRKKIASERKKIVSYNGKVFFNNSPKLAYYRKRTIAKLAERRPKKFQEIYYKARLEYQALLARLVKELKKCGVHATITAKFAPREHEKSGHVELFREGITAAENADWLSANKLVKKLMPKRKELELHLKEFLKVAEEKQLNISPFPSDINNCFNTITTVINHAHRSGKMPY